MKILIVGTWRWPQYEEAFAQGLRDNGAEVTELSVAKFFSRYFGRLQQALPLPSFAMLKLNHAIVSAVYKHQYDVVLFWRPTHIFPATLRQLSKMRVRAVSYNNDDPFAPKAHGNVPWHHHFLWYWYLKCLPVFDLNFFYRKINCAEAMAHGANHAEVLLPYFMPWQDRPVVLSDDDRQRYETDIVFIGHYEPDGREEKIRTLVATGLRVKLWGGHYWSRNVLGDLYDEMAPIEPAEGEEYAKALCGAKVCLCFLSKLNRDTYTRRCFEIPACGRVMLAERTDDLLTMFKEDEEACFFSSSQELVAKATWLVENPDIAHRIALAGQRRVWADGHDAKSRIGRFYARLQDARARAQHQIVTGCDDEQTE